MNSNNLTKPRLKFGIAHEIGHVFLGLGHPDQFDSPGEAPLPGTRHVPRLMRSSAIPGAGTLLVKGEWDAAERWLHKFIHPPE